MTRCTAGVTASGFCLVGCFELVQLCAAFRYTQLLVSSSRCALALLMLLRLTALTGDVKAAARHAALGRLGRLILQSTAFCCLTCCTAGVAQADRFKEYILKAAAQHATRVHCPLGARSAASLCGHHQEETKRGGRHHVSTLPQAALWRDCLLCSHCQ